MTTTITGIDKSASSISFTGPNGWKYSRRVIDPTVFDKVKGRRPGRHYLGHKRHGRGAVNNTTSALLISKVPTSSGLQRGTG